MELTNRYSDEDVSEGGNDGFFDDMTIAGFQGEELTDKQRFLNALLQRDWDAAAALLDAATTLDAVFLGSFVVRRGEAGTALQVCCKYVAHPRNWLADRSLVIFAQRRIAKGSCTEPLSVIVALQTLCGAPEHRFFTHPALPPSWTVATVPPFEKMRFSVMA